MSSSATDRLFRFGMAALVALLPALSDALAQFGQNKIAYDRFDWKVYASPHFDVYHYGAEEVFLQDIVSSAESAYLKISKDLDHELKARVPLVIYKTHAEFEQTNITLGEIPEAVGAFAEPVQNRMVIPIDQPPDKLYALIAHELTHIFQYSLLYDGYLGRALRGNPPLWIMEGLASYLAQDEDSLDQMIIRDAVVNNILPPIQDLGQLSFLTYRYGHAIFDFIETEFGKEGLRNFIYEYRKVLLTDNLQKAVKETFGYEMDEFNRRYNRFLRKKYFPVLLEKKAPEDYGKEIGIRREGVFTFSPTISPSGELVAALASPKLELDLVVLSAEDGSALRNLTRGWTNRYEYLVAEAFSGKRDLSWSPAGDEVAVFARRENARPLLLFNVLSGKLVREVPLAGLSQCASPAFSPDGTRVAFEANRGGVVDLFEVELATGQIRNLTQDDFYDANPWYAADGKTILYNRRIGAYWKIFSADLSDPARKTQLTFGPSHDIQPALSRDGKAVYFSSDRGPYGVFNISALDLASGEIRQYTDVVGGCFSPAEMAERDGEPYLVFVSFFEGTFRLFRMPVKNPVSRVDSRETEAAPGSEVAPFEPPLNLTVDTQNIKPYELRWDLEAPYVTVGVANDGTFLADAALQFTDLLGDHRVQIIASSVAEFTNVNVSYLNLKDRLRWGASLFDYRNYYAQISDAGVDRQQTQRATGGDFLVEYPLSRSYRVDGSAGFADTSQDYISGYNEYGLPSFESINQRFLLFGASFTGDTTRFMEFGPFQGKRFTLGARYGLDLGGDLPGNLLDYTFDFRAYKQLTRRSLLAFRMAGAYSAGQREVYWAIGGINQIRGYDYRSFFGSRVFWSNLELRFPLVDQLRFPFAGIRSIRGFLFADAGAAWLRDGLWYDPDTGYLRVDPESGPVSFKFWDSENGRLQDARGSYGFGVQFLFLGGLQFNWAWSHRMAYTAYVRETPGNPFSPLVPTKADSGGRQMEFYIVFDF